MSPLIDFLFSPVFLLISLFLAAGVVHLMLRLFGGASQDYSFTVRLFCFAYSPQILGIIPRFGGWLGTIWMVVVAVIGLRAAHRTTTGRAAAAVLIPFAIGMIFVMIAWFIARTSSLLQLPV